MKRRVPRNPPPPPPPNESVSHCNECYSVHVHCMYDDSLAAPPTFVRDVTRARRRASRLQNNIHT